MSFGLDDQTIAKINTIFASTPQVKQVKVYGSRAKGTYKNGSDIDLCIYADEMTLSQLHTLETALDDLLLPYTFDLTIYHQIQNKTLKEHIDRIGIIFFSAD